MVMKAQLSEALGSFLGRFFVKRINLEAQTWAEGQFPRIPGSLWKEKWSLPLPQTPGASDKGRKRWEKGKKWKNQNEMDILKSQFFEELQAGF